MLLVQALGQFGHIDESRALARYLTQGFAKVLETCSPDLPILLLRLVELGAIEAPDGIHVAL